MTTRDNLLSILSTQGEYLSGEELARRLGISRAAVWKGIRALREAGYRIDAVTNRGYRLSPEADYATEEGISAHLSPQSGLSVAVLPSVESTNSRLRSLAEQGEPEGRILVANEQTGGRGRMGRAFFSPKGTGLYMSVLLRPRSRGTQEIVRVTTIAAVALCEAIEAATGEAPKIKWVNDLFLHGKKIAGILTEASFSLENGAPDYAVVGAGINLYPPEGGFPPEIRDIAGSILPCPRAGVKNRVCAEFARRLAAYCDHLDPGEYAEAYRRRCLALGRDVLVQSGPTVRQAHVCGIDGECRLLVQYPDGTTAALSSGEISIQIDGRREK